MRFKKKNSATFINQASQIHVNIFCSVCILDQIHVHVMILNYNNVSILDRTKLMCICKILQTTEHWSF